MNHLRTWGGELEVDLVVVRGDQRVVAVEVKLTAAVADRDVRRLRRLGDRIGPQLLSAAGPANACPRCDNGVHRTDDARNSEVEATCRGSRWAHEMSDGATRRRGTGTIDDDVLERLVETVVRTADPERVILFGSAARGELTDDSDIDILVVKDQCQPLELAGDIQVALPAELHPVDIIVVWPEDLETYEDTPWRPISSALHEGRTLYVNGEQTVRAVPQRGRRGPPLRVQGIAPKSPAPSSASPGRLPTASPPLHAACRRCHRSSPTR